MTPDKPTYSAQYARRNIHFHIEWVVQFSHTQVGKIIDVVRDKCQGKDSPQEERVTMQHTHDHAVQRNQNNRVRKGIVQ